MLRDGLVILNIQSNSVIKNSTDHKYLFAITVTYRYNCKAKWDKSVNKFCSLYSCEFVIIGIVKSELDRMSQIS